MPLFAGWFRHQRHHQSKDPTAAGVEGPSISSPSGGLSRLASLTRARLLRSGLPISQLLHVEQIRAASVRSASNCIWPIFGPYQPHWANT